MTATIPSINDLFNAGVHFGHQTNKWNPKMAKFIHSSALGVHIIDLTKTEEKLKEACKFLEKEASENSQILFVGTKNQASEIVKSEATRANVSFVANRWVGGMLTNVTTIKSSIRKLNDLTKKMSSGEFDSLTKKEKRNISKEIEKLETIYGGMKNLINPKVIVIVDPIREDTALKEAKSLGIKVVALADTNTNPKDIDYLIPGNDDAIRSISIVLTSLADACERGHKSYKDTK